MQTLEKWKEVNDSIPYNIIYLAVKKIAKHLKLIYIEMHEVDSIWAIKNELKSSD